LRPVWPPEPRLGRLALLFVLDWDPPALPAAVRPFVVAAMFELLHFDVAPAGPPGCKRTIKHT
jgi:hypothetical protein